MYLWNPSWRGGSHAALKTQGEEEPRELTELVTSVFCHAWMLCARHYELHLDIPNIQYSLQASEMLKITLQIAWSKRFKENFRN
jgi:hypothetical protein